MHTEQSGPSGYRTYLGCQVDHHGDGEEKIHQIRDSQSDPTVGVDRQIITPDSLLSFITSFHPHPQLYFYFHASIHSFSFQGWPDRTASDWTLVHRSAGEANKQNLTQMWLDVHNFSSWKAGPKENCSSQQFNLRYIINYLNNKKFNSL